MDPLIWNWNPEIFRWQIPILGMPLAPRYYGALFAIGFWCSFRMMEKIFAREGKDPEILSHLLTNFFVGTIVGARLGHCFFYDLEETLKNPLKIFFVWEGGLASHGGTLGVLLGIWLFYKKYLKDSITWLMDHLAYPVAFTCGLIRCGNFFNSEIIGKPTRLPWAVVFQKVDNIPRHPAMLYEAFSYFLLCAVLFILHEKKLKELREGTLTGIFFCWVFGSRFLIEFIKENQSDFESGMALNMGQLLSIPLVALGVIYILGKHETLFPFLKYQGPKLDAIKLAKAPEKRT